MSEFYEEKDPNKKNRPISDVIVFLVCPGRFVPPSLCTQTRQPPTPLYTNARVADSGEPSCCTRSVVSLKPMSYGFYISVPVTARQPFYVATLAGQDT